MGIVYCNSILVCRNEEQIIKIESVSNHLDESERTESYTFKDITINFDIVIQETDVYIDTDNEECPIRLFQNKDYWVTFFNKQINEFKLFEDVFFRNKVKVGKNESTGIFNSNNYVGILNLDSISIIENIIEIESTKINYREDFNYLLQEISDFFIELVSRSSSLFEGRFTKGEIISDYDINYYSTFAFIKNLLDEKNIPMWIDHISKNTQSKLQLYKEEEYGWEIDELDIDDCIDAFTDPSNIVEYNDSIRGDMRIPLKLSSVKYIDSIDTNENQFIKFFLSYIREILLSLQEHISLKNKRISIEIEKSINIVNDKLMLHFFREISNMNSIPFNSQVLQKKYPYNKLFKAYNDILLVPDLKIDILDEQFCMGQKDVPKLYEYWVLIKIFNKLNSKYENDFSKCNWISYDKRTLNVNLNTVEKGYVTYFIRSDVELRLYYQKKYLRENSIYEGRSYSHQLDPDISLELYTDSTLLAIIHFDAKYKVPDNQEYKSEDINKMHTYKDAIIGTIGAYAICLSEKSCIFKQEELLRKEDINEDVLFPSVGALPMNINSEFESKDLNGIFTIIDKFIGLALDDKLNGIFDKDNNISYKALKRMIYNIH